MEKCGIVFFMKTHPPPASTQLHNGLPIGRRASHDWKRFFRLNALDLNPLLQNTTTEAQPWVCDEPQLMRLLQLVNDEISSLNGLLRTAGEPILSCKPADLLRMLGVASIRNPSRRALHQAWQAPQGNHPPVGLSDQELPHWLVPGVRAESEPASRVFTIRTEVFRSAEACGGQALP